MNKLKLNDANTDVMVGASSQNQSTTILHNFDFLNKFFFYLAFLCVRFSVLNLSIIMTSVVCFHRKRTEKKVGKKAKQCIQN